MKTFYRNFTHTFRRFFTASVLNIAGLAIAFASFLVILTQVDYDRRYNRCYRHCDRIVRAEFYPNADWGWTLTLARPFAELIGSSSPHVEVMAIIDGWGSVYPVEVDGHPYQLPVRGGFGNYLQVFAPDMLAGSTEALLEDRQVLIPASMARQLFGTVDAVGKTIYKNRQADNNPYYVGDVYRDFPANCTLGNPLFYRFDEHLNQDNWSDWNYHCYYLLDRPDAAGEVRQTAFG